MKKLPFKFGAEVYTWYMNNNGETYKDQLGHMIEIISKAGFTGIQPIFSWMGKLSDFCFGWGGRYFYSGMDDQGSCRSYPQFPIAYLP
jgi:hypothetical protein